MSRWPSTHASCVLSALLRIGWQIIRTTGFHRVLAWTGCPDVLFTFRDRDEIGPKMLVRLEGSRDSHRAIYKVMKTRTEKTRTFYCSDEIAHTALSCLIEQVFGPSR